MHDTSSEKSDLNALKPRDVSAHVNLQPSSARILNRRVFRPLSLLSRITEHTSPPRMLLRLLVIDEKLSLLTIPSRFIAGDFHDGEVGAAFVEDAVHFFQGAVCGFGVEEVDGGEYEGVAEQGQVSNWNYGDDGKG